MTKKRKDPDVPASHTEEGVEPKHTTDGEPTDVPNTTAVQDDAVELTDDTPQENVPTMPMEDNAPEEGAPVWQEPDAGDEPTPEDLPPDETQPEVLSLDITPLDAEPMPDVPGDAAGDATDDFDPPSGDPPLEENTTGELLTPPEPPMASVKQPRQASDRQAFFDLDFNDLDRDLTTDERKEWNAIYASFRGRSALTGTIIGVDRHRVNVRDPKTHALRQEDMYCVIVVPYRVRIVIPAAEMWEEGHDRPDFVLQNMVGSTIDFIITKVDREAEFAIGSRRMAARARRFYFSRRAALHSPGAKLKCKVLAVGPRRCLVECFGHDVNLTQRELRYAAIPDLRSEYRPGQELECIVKEYDAEAGTLRISVKDMFANPFDGASERHPVGCRRQAIISGKYGGGVFCNLPDGTVCMCSYAYQYDDSQFGMGDSAIVVIQRYDMGKKQIYGKIISKW